MTVYSDEKVQPSNPAEENADMYFEQEPSIIQEGEIPEESSEYSPQEREQMMEKYAATFHSLTEGTIVKGTVLEVLPDEVIIDVGFKSEGIIPRGQFDDDVEIGNDVDVFLEAIEDENGYIVISKRKADFLRVWQNVEDAFHSERLIDGVVKHRIKGGMIVDIDGVDAFLPGSQVSLRRVPDFDALIGETMSFKILKLNRKRRNIVVSHRAILEEERQKRRSELLQQIEEGQVRKGIVKNITDFGVFVDLGGLDGLLHITDMSWTRINHPSELVNIGEEVEVKVLKFDSEKERISLGLKQLTPSPWDMVPEKYPVGSRVRGKVVNITKYGAFVELEKGVEGLVHISEMSWTKHINHPSELMKVGDEIECVVIDIDKENQKISLGIKQLTPDPWSVIDERYPIGSKVSGIVRNMTSFGVFVELEEGIDALIHISDISWTKRINHPSEILRKGQEIEGIVLDIDKERHRISLGYKQLQRDPWPELEARYGVGVETRGKIIRMTDRGVTVALQDDVEGFLPVTQLGKSVDKPSDAFNIGDILPMKVIEFDTEDHRIVLSVNAYFASKEQDDLERYAVAHPTKTVRIDEIARVTGSMQEETAEPPTSSGSDEEYVSPDLPSDAENDETLEDEQVAQEPDSSREEETVSSDDDTQPPASVATTFETNDIGETEEAGGDTRA